MKIAQVRQTALDGMRSAHPFDRSPMRLPELAQGRIIDQTRYKNKAQTHHGWQIRCMPSRDALRTIGSAQLTNLRCGIVKTAAKGPVQRNDGLSVITAGEGKLDVTLSMGVARLAEFLPRFGAHIFAGLRSLHIRDDLLAHRDYPKHPLLHAAIHPACLSTSTMNAKRRLTIGQHETNHAHDRYTDQGNGPFAPRRGDAGLLGCP